VYLPSLPEFAITRSTQGSSVALLVRSSACECVAGNQDRDQYRSFGPSDISFYGDIAAKRLWGSNLCLSTRSGFNRCVADGAKILCRRVPNHGMESSSSRESHTCGLPKVRRHSAYDGQSPDTGGRVMFNCPCNGVATTDKRGAGNVQHTLPAGAA